MIQTATNLQGLIEVQSRSDLALILNSEIPQQTIISIDSISSSFLSIFLEYIRRQRKANHLILCADREQAHYLLNDIENISNSRELAFLLPEIYKYHGGRFVMDQSHQVLRTEATMRVGQPHQTIWLTYPEAMIEKIPQVQLLEDHSIRIKHGERTNPDVIVERLINLGFIKEDFVYEPGHFSRRGDIMDVYSYGNENPYRIEFFDDEVDSIRIFNPETQLSDRKLLEINLIPNAQIKNYQQAQQLVSIMDWIPENTMVWTFDLDRIKQTIIELEKSIPDEFVISSEDIGLEIKVTRSDFDTWSHWEYCLSQKTLINSSPRGTSPELYDKWKAHSQIMLGQKPQESFNKNFDLFRRNLLDYHAKGYNLYMFAENPQQLHRIQAILDDMKTDVDLIPVPVGLSTGYVDHQMKYLCYTDHEIFQRYHKYRTKQAYNRQKAISFRTLQELVPGDYVVHIDHGIGKYSGLQKIDVNGNIQEAVRILYKDNDVLYVNINSLHKISKYTGKEGTEPSVHKIGGDAWEKRKLKAKNRIKTLAFDLINLYAERKAKKGFAFHPDTYLQTELEASFFYEDTPDQVKSTLDVKEDMQSESPMDRLICGDVGFGKTEIAVRAAFKAAVDGKQVAVLVPTTILAYQHYKTFSDRLKEFPCTVEYINRFKTSKQKTEITKQLAEGKINILIGTHAILNSKIQFKDLGLLIIDEEQKFGVGAKEKLRNYKANIDTLTLSATPIPRTLQFSLMGARDLSVIATPPLNRQPVNTEIIVFDENIIKEAIDYELARGGQVYFVHNRIQSLPDIATVISRLCPQAQVVVAHGQLDGSQMEEILVDFIEGKFDVLVSTNIIESGVDIANANTMFINNAQHFGLSDLHQLRGRVGRSNKKAFCYLIAPPLVTLPNDSKKRLIALEEFSELGSGFQIAMRDLDIRGAGDILGAEQSGFINDIGYDMYQKILNQALRELKETSFKDLLDEKESIELVDDCTIDTDQEVLIPDYYVNSIQERLSLYTRLDNLKDESDLYLFEKELKDRFGALPVPVIRLTDLLRSRWIAQTLGIEKIILKSNTLRFYFVNNPDSAYYQSELFQKLMKFVQLRVAMGRFKNVGTTFLLVIERIDSIEQMYDLLVSMKEYCFTNNENTA